MIRSETLDARGLLCPMPVIRVQDRIKTLPNGCLLEVICSDPGVVNDIPAWCRLFGHTVTAIAETRDEIRITIKISKS